MQDLYTSFMFVRKCGKDKNSINICGGCWSSLRWAAICRLISTGYIIEIFFFSLHSVSIGCRKCDPQAETKMGLCIFFNTVSSMNFGRCYWLFCGLICALESSLWALMMGFIYIYICKKWAQKINGFKYAHISLWGLQDWSVCMDLDARTICVLFVKLFKQFLIIFKWCSR